VTAPEQLLDELRALAAENEWLDFKEAKTSFDLDRLGQYVSALANEANLANRECGWLIFGVRDKRDPVTGLRPVVGSRFKQSESALNELKQSISEFTSPSITFSEVYEINHPDCQAGSRVLMLAVPAAPRGAPVAWRGHRYGRSGESQGALSDVKHDAIRMQAGVLDWTAECVPQGGWQLSAAALERARVLYAAKHPRRAADLAEWDTSRFLSELRVSRAGALTRAALLLFGEPAAVAQLGGASPRLTWRLTDSNDQLLDHEHFQLPLVVAMDALVAKVRIHRVAVLPPGQLAPLDLPNYDDWVLREALLNCVAHQDYRMGGRVVVTESPTTLHFSNAGAFIPGSLERVLHATTAVHQYRNPCLAEALVELGLIDTISSGIKRMFRTQRERYFPLPDFEIENHPPTLAVRLYGREIDPGFTRALLLDTDLSLAEVVALDQIQKRRKVATDVLKGLRQRRLVEGRGGSVHIAAVVADAVNQRGQYARQRGLDMPALKQLVLSLIDRFGKASRDEINQTLLTAMPAGLTPAQKANRIKNLLSDLSTRDGLIEANRRGVGATWRRKPQPVQVVSGQKSSDNL
jgi:ATP-dependent DNA helicase RecG